jgi:multiple sugar transport system permease protein
MAVTTMPATKPRKRPTQAAREARLFYLLVSPWVIGFVLLTLGPMLVSLYLSLTRWDVLTSPEFIGARNFEFIFTRDPDFVQSLKVTTTYAIFSIPLQLLAGLGLAILLNEATRGSGFFRTVFYLPAVVASVAAAVLWAWIFNSELGPINGLLGVFGIKGPAWFADPDYALWALIIMSMWGVGGQMLVFLAGLKGIPAPLYEAAEIDGAGRLARFFRITLPMLSSTLFFNFVTSIIGAFQTFDAAYVISTQRAGTLGGPLKSTLFYMLNTYSKAFGSETKMGYAAALSWILFFIILVLTLITIRSSSMWVYYESERKR